VVLGLSLLAQKLGFLRHLATRRDYTSRRSAAQFKQRCALFRMNLLAILSKSLTSRFQIAWISPR
jgi:hypothetical protein